MPEQTLTEIVAFKIKTLRLRKKLSLEALAKKAGISVSYVSMLEREQRSPPLETIEKIARALQVSPLMLLGA
jgi:transcriptional regulator with XRE-family HTH domain